MKSVVFTLNGTKYGLYYNGTAMFDIQDLLGDTDIFEILRGRSREKYERLAQIVEILNDQYRAAMRVRNPAEQTAALTAENIRASAAIRDIEALQRVVMEAIDVGLSQEEGDEEIDLGLIEFQKNGQDKIRRARYTMIGLRMGLTYQETMLLPPGELFDLAEVYGGKKKEAD